MRDPPRYLDRGGGYPGRSLLGPRRTPKTKKHRVTLVKRYSGIPFVSKPSHETVARCDFRIEKSRFMEDPLAVADATAASRLQGARIKFLTPRGYLDRPGPSRARTRVSEICSPNFSALGSGTTSSRCPKCTA